MAAPIELFDPAAFMAALPAHGALLGLDPGTKTIGVALSATDRSLASPLTTVRRTKMVGDVAALQAIVEAEQVCGLVIGMPYNMDGTAGPRAQSVRAFRRELAKHITLPMLFWDERLSSEQAKSTMQDAGRSRADIESQIDAAAAAHILSECLHHLASITNQ